MKTWLKRKTKHSEFLKLAEQLGADYVEGDCEAVFIAEKYGGILGLAFTDKGQVEGGFINESCDNFDNKINGIYAQEVEWIIETLQKLLNSGKVRKWRKGD